MKYPEHELQKACVKYFDLQYPKLRLNLFHIPNERKQSVIAGERLKSIGQRSGVADLLLAIPKDIGNGICCGVFIEMKSLKGKLTDSQILFQNAVTKNGYRYEVVKSFDEFKTLIKKHLEKIY